MNFIRQIHSTSHLKMLLVRKSRCFKPIHQIFQPRALRPFHTSTPKQSFYIKFIRKPTIRELKVKDDVPDGFSLIYRNGMGRYIYVAQGIITLTVALVVVAFCLKKDYGKMDLQYEKWTSRSREVENEGLIFISMFLIFIILLQTVIAKIPMRIYKVPRTPKYAMIFNGNLPFTLNKVFAERGKIFQLEPSGVLPWRDCRYLLEIKKEEKEVILFEHYFSKPGDLPIMLAQQNDPELDDNRQ